MPSKKANPRDATGAKRDRLQAEHAAEIEKRQGEMSVAARSDTRTSDEVIDMTGGQPRAAIDPGSVIDTEEAEAWRQGQGAGPRQATKQPGQTGVSVDADGVMTDTAQPGWSVKTNDKGVTGIGTEGPGAIPGGTIADGRVRPTVDTTNAARVGTPGGPDVEAPRVWTAARGQEVVEVEGGVRTAEAPTREIRVNTTVENMTYGAGTDYTFVEGQKYRVPAHIADHLEDLGYVWH